MAFKYKLVKEISPKNLKTAAGTVGPDVMKNIGAGKLSIPDYEGLKDLLLQKTNIDPIELEQILDIWYQRSKDFKLNERHSELKETIIKRLKKRTR
jgi:hypothetical protein